MSSQGCSNSFSPILRVVGSNRNNAKRSAPARLETISVLSSVSKLSLIHISYSIGSVSLIQLPTPRSVRFGSPSGHRTLNIFSLGNSSDRSGQKENSVGVFDKKKIGCGTNNLRSDGLFAVSYTHLDVYKGQIRHTDAFAMRYNPEPPYNILSNTELSFADVQRISLSLIHI